MNNVAHETAKRPPSRTTQRQLGFTTVDDNATLGEEIRRQVAWIVLAGREMDHGDFASGTANLNEAVAWLMTIALEVDELESSVCRARDAALPVDRRSFLDLAIHYYSFASTPRWSEDVLSRARSGALGFGANDIDPQEWAEALDDAAGIVDAERVKRREQIRRSKHAKTAKNSTKSDVAADAIDAAAEE